MNSDAMDRFNALGREQMREETKKLSPLFLDYLEQLAEGSISDDRPGYHEELIAEIRRLRADYNACMVDFGKVGAQRDEWKADSIRLRGLFKGIENGSPFLEGLCPFCAADRDFVGPREPHKADCPAFTPDGQVR